MGDWINQFPTKVGWYLFWGDPYTMKLEDYKYQLHTVVVRKGANSLIYIIDGHFFDNHYDIGYWKKIEISAPKTEIKYYKEN